MRYILITAARNEAAYIGETLAAVTAQTIPPVRWVIISDGSTDGTDDLIADFSSRFPYIDFLRTETDEERSFGSKARAINHGFERTRELDVDCVGILDADVSFPDNYYETLLPKFSADKQLGIAGGFVLDRGEGKWIRRKLSVDYSVRGPVQFFRRECWEQVGGYSVLPYGGVDGVAESTARMLGWKVRTFLDVEAFHHRPTGTETQSVLAARIKLGRQAKVNGYHPLFIPFRAANQIKEKPFLLGSLGYLWGFLLATIAREPFAVPGDLVGFLRREQIDRIKQQLKLK